jgi:hypothetical protein
MSGLGGYWAYVESLLTKLRGFVVSRRIRLVEYTEAGSVQDGPGLAQCGGRWSL